MRIVTISLLSALDAISDIAVYARAKLASVRFVEAAAAEYRAKRLRINAILPSNNDTNTLPNGL
jgi:NAD(P)-dependent dehydrogenase (short-subunit alcohol dehydrogenase family)